MQEVTDQVFTAKQVENINSLVNDLESDPKYLDAPDYVIYKEAERLAKMGVTSYRSGDMREPFKEFIVEKHETGPMDVKYSVSVGMSDEINEVRFTDEKEDTCYKLSGDGVIYTIAGCTMLMRRDNTRLEIYNATSIKDGKFSKEDARRIWEFFTMLGYEVLEECD